MDRGVFVRMDEVVPRPVSWLWPGRLPLGKLTLLAGDPGLGKSFFTTWLAARVSRCDDLPDGKNGLRKPGDVLILSAEDDASDTIRPRLEMHGADLRRVQVLQSVQQGDRTRTVSVDLDKHMPVLEQWLLEAPRPRLIVVDPITAYMGQTDANSNAEVRSLLGNLGALAAAKGVAVVCVSHLSKGSPNSKTVYRTIGSLAFTAAARVVYSVTAGAQAGEERMVLVVKSNLDMKPGGMSYRITDAGIEWISMDVRMRADDAENAERVDERSQFEEGKEFLAAALAAGPVPAADLFAQAEAEGIGAKSLRSAKKALRAEAVRSGRPPTWSWRLAAQPAGAQPGSAAGGDA